ncbi:MAG: rhodanese-like domain-containing protein [Candidatus Bathyarchaeales archaeon]
MVDFNTVKSHKLKVVTGAVLVMMLLSAFSLAQPVAWASFYSPPPPSMDIPTPQPGTYQNISVQLAYYMITLSPNKPALILDVRYQCEYDMGHLQGAVLIPYDQLQARIKEAQPYRNQTIIVYCKTGVRSAIASGILVSNNFTRVYNMVGGIFAWIQAGYPIYTSSHYVTVNMAYGFVSAQIDPMTLHQTGPPSCMQNQTSLQNSTCPVCGKSTSSAIAGNNSATYANDTVTVGSMITLFGTGATPNGEVRMYVYGQFWATATADESGNYSINMTVPTIPKNSFLHICN